MRTVVLALLAVAASSVSAAAAEQRVVLAVDNMTCAPCPYVVRKALNSVAGVRSAEVDYDKRRAVVVYDDAVTTASALTAATANAGFPSRVARP
jgi:mercuric ion binding protein